MLEAVQEGEDDGLGLLGSASAKLAVLLIASASSRTRRGRRTVPQRDAEREQEASRPRQRQLARSPASCKFRPHVSNRAFECTTGLNLLTPRDLERPGGEPQGLYSLTLRRARWTLGLGQPNSSTLRCSDQSRGNWVIRVRRAAVSFIGCRPSRMANTISGAKNASRARRVRYDLLIPSERDVSVRLASRKKAKVAPCSREGASSDNVSAIRRRRLS